MMHDSAIDAKARAYIHMACIEEIKDFGDRVEDWEDRGKRNALGFKPRSPMGEGQNL